MSKPVCKDCIAFSALTRECRMHAPTAVPLIQQQPFAVNAAGIWPATSDDKWCIEFRLDPALSVQ